LHQLQTHKLTSAVTCFGYEGIDAVKTALRCAEAKNTPDNQVKVKLVSPPLYGELRPIFEFAHTR
jgi:translation initiation factor 2 alpha subunit (eIF-2alpha)